MLFSFIIWMILLIWVYVVIVFNFRSISQWTIMDNIGRRRRSIFWVGTLQCMTRIERRHMIGSNSIISSASKCCFHICLKLVNFTKTDRSSNPKPPWNYNDSPWAIWRKENIHTSQSVVIVQFSWWSSLSI